MIAVDMPSFYLGVQEELEKAARCWEGYEPVPGKEPYSEDSCRPKGSKKKEKKADLQTSVPRETPEMLLSRVRQNKINFPKFVDNAAQHTWNVPGVPFANTLVKKFIKTNANNPAAFQEKVKGMEDSSILKVINKNPEAFRGVQNQPVQTAAKIAFDVGAMPVNENILPNITNQAKWKYVRTKGGLKLSDGNLVYGFGGFPDEYPAEDARVNRTDDDNILNFENDALSKGTAQIHRSSPDNIYVTLANGAQNPTFMLQHEEGKNWRYSPSKKFVEKLKAIKDKISPEAGQTEKELAPSDSTLIDPESLLKGAEDFIKESYDINAGLIGSSDKATELITDLINKTKNFGNKAIDFGAAHPFITMLGGYGAAKAVGKIKDNLNPMRELERDNSTSGRILNEMVPAAAGVLPAILAGAIRS